MLDNDLIKSEYQAIQLREMPRVFYKVTAEVVAGGRTISVPNVVSVETIRDYAGQYADETYLQTQIGTTTFKDLILTKKDNLQVKLIKTPQSDDGLEISGAQQDIVYYDAYIVNALDVDVTSPSRSMDNALVNEMTLLDVTFQLTAPKLAEMRLVDVSGIYQGLTVQEFLKAMMSYDLGSSTAESSLTDDTYTGVKGVDVVDCINTVTYDHLIIPTGIRITKLPHYLQREKGVYAAGIGRYYQSGMWYIYPLYDYSRWDSVNDRLTVINMPSDEVMSPERSYRVNASTVTILATGNTSVIDDTESAAHNVGSGIRISRADKLIDGMVNTSTNKTTPDVDTSNQSMGIEERKNELYNIPYSKRGVTNNPYPELSEMARGMGTTVVVTWENAKPSLLYPAMPVKFMYTKAGEVQTLYGTLLGVRETTMPTRGGFIDNDYRTHCKLVLYVEKRLTD